MERWCRDVLHDQMSVAVPVVEDVVHFGHVQVECRGLSLCIEVRLGARLCLQARVSTLDEYLRARGRWDYIRPRAIGAEVNDVSLGRRKRQVDALGKLSPLGVCMGEGHELEAY